MIRRMRFDCLITKATDTHSEYVVLIAFPQQQWLRERVSMLRYTYIACLVNSSFECSHKLERRADYRQERVTCALYNKMLCSKSTFVNSSSFRAI